MNNSDIRLLVQLKHFPVEETDEYANNIPMRVRMRVFDHLVKDTNKVFTYNKGFKYLLTMLYDKDDFALLLEDELVRHYTREKNKELRREKKKQKQNNNNLS